MRRSVNELLTGWDWGRFMAASKVLGEESVKEIGK